MNSQTLSFVNLFKDFVIEEIKALIRNKLKHQVMLACIKPLGHFKRCDVQFSFASCHGKKQLQQRMLFTRLHGLVPGWDITNHKATIQHLIIERKIIGRDDRNACFLL